MRLAWTVKGSATVVAIGVGRHGVGRDNNPRRRLVCASQAPADARHPAGSPLTPSRSLDLYASSDYHSCSKCFFSASPHRRRPRRNCWPQPNHRSDLSVYSIYKETHSSDGPQRTKGTMQDGPLTGTTRYFAPTNSTKEGIA